MLEQVKLRSSDQQMFEVEEDVAFQSLTVKNMSEGPFPAKYDIYKSSVLKQEFAFQTPAWTRQYHCQTFQAKF